MKRKKQMIFTEYKAEKFLAKYLPIAKNQLVKRGDEISMKPPFVMKIISPQALHKSDINGVRIIKNQEDIPGQFNDLLKIVKKRRIKLDGILVQQFIEGEQLIIGIKKDPIFGHIILFGIGGIFTEVYDDTSIRKCPITKTDAQEMIDELKARQIFYGFRGKKLNVNLLKETLVKVSQIPSKNKKIEELDINPFILNEKSGVVVDARIVFTQKP
jgi:hypothetical protein